MLRETIKINEHTFVCDLYTYDELETKTESTFIVLRSMDIIQSTIVDNEIYIIDSSLCKFENDILIGFDNSVIFPIPNEIQRYSKNIDDFFNSSNLIYSKLYNDNLVEKRIKCNKVQVYHPLTKTHNINFIVHLDNVINGIHFHYFCKEYNDININSETEFKIGNNIYSEYIEFFVPCVEDIINKETFFKEETSISHVNNEKYLDLIKTHTENNVVNTFCSMYLLNIPFIVSDGTKMYLPEITKTIETNYSIYPINITLYPFTYPVESGLYYPDSVLTANSDIFVSAPKINIISNIKFNNIGKIVIGMEFNYPNKDNFNSIEEAYQYYNNVSLNEYSNLMAEDGDQEFISENTSIFYPFVYMLELASDQAFKNIIYQSPFLINETVKTSIENIEFDIPIFNNWDQMPELLLYRVSFLDRYLGISLKSNIGIINKEHYKYLVSKDNKINNNVYRLNLKDIEDMDFIDKVTCIINRVENTNNTPQISSTPKIVYKPIFFRTQDLQNIKIKAGVTQNIGVNLGNYITKVETFYITIDGVQFIESGRNDVYVIFPIQANKLTNTSGSYHISNQDNEYISSGSWSIN